MAHAGAEHFLLPGLPRFLEAYPEIRLHIGEAHQALDMVREGFDCIPYARANSPWTAR